MFYRACLCVSLLDCLLVWCLPTWSSESLIVGLHIYLHGHCFIVYLFACLTWLISYLHECLLEWLFSCMIVYLLACLISWLIPKRRVCLLMNECLRACLLEWQCLWFLLTCTTINLLDWLLTSLLTCMIACVLVCPFPWLLAYILTTIIATYSLSFWCSEMTPVMALPTGTSYENVLSQLLT